MHRFESAPWSKLLKVTSLVGSVILIGVGATIAITVPRGASVPYLGALAPLVAIIPPAMALVAVLFIVAGYELEPGYLRVRRLLWFTRIPLAGLHRIYADPASMDGSTRIFGNGGLFSFTGLYRNRTLGRYRAFVTDPARAVVLVLPNRVVVVSPADTGAFVRSVHARYSVALVVPPSAAV